MAGVHSHRGDLRNPGVHTIMRDDIEIGVLSFLQPPAREATVLRILCEALDDAEASVA